MKKYDHFRDIFVKYFHKIDLKISLYINHISVKSYRMSSYVEKSPVIIEYNQWDVKQIKYMPPKINDKGGKAINLISTQTNRGLSISTPLMITWGISDYCDEQGNSDGKFSISLSFPNDDYKTDDSDLFLQKCKDFENKIIDDAVLNSELWFGKKKSRELVEDSFFPFLKWSKDKTTKAYDYTKPPSLKIKVPCYKDKNTGLDKWSCQLYDVDYNLIFPNELKQNLTPMDLVPRGSNVVCGFQCTGIWTGGKGWGITWKLVQAIVKPKVIISIYDRCHIRLSTTDKDVIQKQESKVEEEVLPEMENDEPEPEFEEQQQMVHSTTVEDSDNEVEEPESLKEEPVKKKVVKKVETPATTTESIPSSAPATVVKKVVKKKVVTASA